jgi:hypothetical protein
VAKWIPKRIKGIKNQHAELDAEYEAKLLPAEHPMNLWYNISVMRMWAQEKDYLSRYGQRYGKIINIG